MVDSLLRLLMVNP